MTRVLFVEDEAALAHAYRRYFEGRVDMAFAASGEEAVAQFEAFNPDVLVLDLRLPDTDGTDVLRRMRAERPGLPVVITTAYESMQPLMGVMVGLKAFVAAVIGGIGNLPGAVIGALLLGLCEEFIVGYTASSWRDAVAFGFLIVVLLFRPEGLFGRVQAEKV